jgi:hypothetical protein
MPAVVGNIKVVSVSSSSIVQIGDAVLLAPRSVAKTFAGAGSFITGDGAQSSVTFSATNTYDGDGSDSRIIALD